MTTKPFIGFVPNSEKGNAFLADLRKLFKGTGMRVVRMSRNPNRKQFYSTYKYSVGAGIKHPYCQNFPIKFATHYGLYIREKNGNMIYDNDLCIKAKTIYDTLRKIYESHGIDLSIKHHFDTSGISY